MINHRYLQPVFPVTGEVVTSGHFGDLKEKAGAVSVGLFNATNTPNQYYVATGAGNGDRYFIGFSSVATKDSLDKWHFGRTNPIKSHEFRGKDIISFEVSLPERLSPETWHVGYTGVVGCNEPAFSFECGKTYGLMIALGGSPTWRQWAKTLRHEIYVTTPCCDSTECLTGCADSSFDCEYVYRKFAEAINSHNELSLMGVKARYLTSTFSTTSPTHYDYTLTVSDAGLPQDTAAVQASVTEGKVVRIDRVNGKSIYQVTCVLLANAPTTFTAVDDVLLADCGECGAGYTVTEAKDTYTITANEATYANAAAVVTAYEAATTKTFTGVISAPNITANYIPVTAHNFETGQEVVYTDGGGTQIVGLTDTNTYYVIKVDDDTVQLATTKALALAGTAIDITATGIGVSHTLTASGFSATLLTSNPTTEIYSLVVTSGVAVTALSNDLVVLGATAPAYCTPGANSAVSWVQGDGHYKVKRDLCMTLPRKDCNGDNYLAELTAMVEADPTYVAGSIAVVAGTDCSDKYTASQWSDCMQDACLASDTATFGPMLQGFANEDVIGVWEVVEAAAPVYNANKKCGLEITAEVSERYLSDCVMQLNDFYETEPIRLEINWIQNQLTGLPEACGVQSMPKAQRTKFGKHSRQSGEWFLREYIKQSAYNLLGCEESDPKIREVLDQNFRPQVDRKAFYKVYYIQYKTDKGNRHGFDQKPEICEAMIAFKEGDVKAPVFEAAFSGVFAKHGVTLQERK